MNLNELYKQAYYKNKFGMILCGDCVEIMRKMDDACVDLTVTSPPYDNLRTYNGYCFDFENVAKELYRVTKDGGVVVWVVGDATIKGSETGTSFKQALFFKECGFNLHDTMIWQKPNPMPKFRSKRYFDVFEYMFVFSKGQPKTFNPLLVECRYGGEIYSSTCKNRDVESGRTQKQFILNNTRYANNIWVVGVAQNKTGHPAVFPEQLANDHILSWSNPNDIVFDPFMGSGTTAKMAMLNNRRFIGCEISEEYCNIIKDRLNNVQYS